MTTIKVITTQATTAGSSLLLQSLFVVLFAGVLYYLRERNQGRSKKLEQHLAEQDPQSTGQVK